MKKQFLFPLLLMILVCFTSCLGWMATSVEERWPVRDAKEYMYIAMEGYERKLIETGVISSSDDFEEDGWFREKTLFDGSLFSIAYKKSFMHNGVRITCAMIYYVYEETYQFKITFWKNWVDRVEDAYINYDSHSAVFDVLDDLLEPECNLQETVKNLYDYEYMNAQYHQNKKMHTENTSEIRYKIGFEDNLLLYLRIKYYVSHEVAVYSSSGNIKGYFTETEMTAYGTSVEMISYKMLREYPDLERVEV